MNRHELEMARSGLSIFDKELSPDYQALRDRLNGSLGSIATQEGIVSAVENVDLINRCINSLGITPWLTSNSKVKFIAVPDQASGRILQASTTWYMYDYWDDLSYRGCEPVVIIGKRPAGKKKELLLRSVRPIDRSDGDGQKKLPQRGLFSVLMTPKKVEQLEKDMRQALKPFSRNELEEVCNLRAKRIEIRRDTPGSTAIRQRKMRAKDFTLGMSDLDLAEFGVLDYINNLATLFGRKEEVDSVLEAVAQQKTDESGSEVLASS